MDVQPIHPGQQICGRDALEIRRILKRLDGRNLSISDAVNACEISSDELTPLLNKLEAEKYLVLNHGTIAEEIAITPKGKRLYDDGRPSSNKRPLKRTAAEKKLDSVLEKIAQLNNDAYYLYRITRAAVYGSYLTTKTLLGDLDVGIEFTRREPDTGRFSKLNDARIDRARIEYRSFSNIVLEQMEPLLECARFIKKGIPKLAVTTFDQLEEHSFPFKLIYESDGQDFSPSPPNPETLRPYLLPARLQLKVCSLRPTTIGEHHIDVDTPVALITKLPWSPSLTSIEKPSDDWIYESKSFATQRFSTSELLDMAAKIELNGRTIFHCKFAEATAYTQSQQCEKCGQRKWLLKMPGSFSHLMATCENCSHRVVFEWKPTKRR